jgi:cell division protein FtsB
LKEAAAEMKRLTAENQELNRNYKLLLDEITRVKGYSDAKKKEE